MMLFSGFIDPSYIKVEPANNKLVLVSGLLKIWDVLKFFTGSFLCHTTLISWSSDFVSETGSEKFGKCNLFQRLLGGICSFVPLK